MPTSDGHAAYIAAAPEPFRPTLQRLHDRLAAALPEAEEVVAYDLPGFRADGTIVAGYAAFTRQCGLYVQPAAITEHAEAIAAAGLKATKTGVTFTVRKPIPDELVDRLARSSLAAAGA